MLHSISYRACTQAADCATNQREKQHHIYHNTNEKARYKLLTFDTLVQAIVVL